MYHWNSITKTNTFKYAAIVFSILVTAFTLSSYAVLIRTLIRIRYDHWFELAMVAGMIIFQYPFIYKKSFLAKSDYYYNMLLVSLMGSVLLWPLLLLNHFFTCTISFNLIYFFCVVGIMFFTHKKIVARLKLPAILSYTWIAYRFIILIFIL